MYLELLTELKHKRKHTVCGSRIRRPKKNTEYYLGIQG